MSGRFGKCERLKIFWETLVGSNPTSCIGTIFNTCYSIKNGSLEPEVGGCSLVVIMLSLGDKTSKRSRVQLSASPSIFRVFLKASK